MFVVLLQNGRNRVCQAGCVPGVGLDDVGQSLPGRPGRRNSLRLQAEAEAGADPGVLDGLHERPAVTIRYPVPLGPVFPNLYLEGAPGPSSV